jgi:PIN domain nuclease of toxin-antitoxin system
MAIRLVADTHTILWYLYDDPRLSGPAASALDAAELDGDQIAIASITLAEIVYLVEKGRIQQSSFERIASALEDVTSALVEIPFDLSIAKAMRQIERDQVPELPDRIVAATAFYLGIPVVSRDLKIRASIVMTIW